MMSSDHIIEVDETSFQSDVITYSNTIPVVVEFWAAWSQSCQMLTPILERLAKEANGSFRLAKVNSDETPNLNVQMGIQTLPTVKAFHKERLVNEFTGLQSQRFVRDFLKNLVPAAGNLELERAHGLLEMKDYKKAARSFRKALKTDPDNSAALLGLAKSLLAQGDASGSLSVLMDFPAGKEFSAAQQIIPLAQLVSSLETSPDSFLEDTLSSSFRRALTLVRMGNLPAAADGFLDILRQEKDFRNGEAHRAMVGVLAMMDENDPETREYRNELASILF